MAITKLFMLKIIIFESTISDEDLEYFKEHKKIYSTGKYNKILVF